MYYILTTIKEDHWGNIKDNKTRYTRKFLSIKVDSLINNMDTIFLLLDRQSKTKVLKAWYGKVYDIVILDDYISFNVNILREVDIEPDMVKTKIGWFIVHADLPKTFSSIVKNEDGYIIDNVQELKGNWKYGCALDLHTVHSILLPDGHFETERTKIGELLYQLKYCSNRQSLKEIIKYIKLVFNEPSIRSKFPIDVIFPVPPSDKSRSFQPVIEITKLVAEALGVGYDENYIQKIKSTKELKGIDEVIEREKILKDAFILKDEGFKGKSVLLVDDLYRSGITLSTITNILINAGKVSNVYVFTLTKTRSKR